ncbi:alpha-1 like protein [Verticillium longisporum]|uniref:Alpha-1 like protein n=1 Tax=Verticillium longisporum TaxID=100787 RepID=A0A8I2ZII8_VERLO|nr:alpha-1 like protein [Verticillium longisporum]
MSRTITIDDITSQVLPRHRLKSVTASVARSFITDNHRSPLPPSPTLLTSRTVAAAASSPSIDPSTYNRFATGAPQKIYLGVQGQSSNLPPIPGTPADPMSLSRSPSPHPGGGWASPGLNYNSGRNSPTGSFPFPSPGGISAPWEATKMRTLGVTGYPSFSTHNQGFFQRHMRRISSSLPRFSQANQPQYGGFKDKQTRGPWSVQNLPLVGRMQRRAARMKRKTKIRLAILFFILFAVWVFYHSPLVYHWRRTSWLGGGQKYVIILAANVGGGVMEWKGAREWAIERDSVKNKKAYAARWGYELEIVDMSTKKRYAHEWREGWEKVDYVRNALRKYPKAEWVSWLDLNTFVMEPSYSLQSHIFNDLAKNTYRDINEFNPLNISHPFTEEYLDPTSRSPVGDGKPESINLILSQDCAGFNLGSWFLRRGAVSDQLMDVWWDPVAYEQKHMEWTHKEQDALQQMYRTQPWVRQHTAFLPQRSINAFPAGACGDDGKDPRYHYSQDERDFVVNMAGCEWGRDCWGEMFHFRQLSYYLNRNLWERFKEDLIAVLWFKLTGQHVRL